MKLFKKAKSLEGFLIQLEAKISEEHEVRSIHVEWASLHMIVSKSENSWIDRNSLSK